jgi:hypothetical protein
LAIEEQGVVFVGLKEIYEKVVQLGVKVDVLLSQHSDAINDIKDHESRLRSLERARWPLPALATIVSIVALILSFVQFGPS